MVATATLRTWLGTLLLAVLLPGAARAQESPGGFESTALPGSVASLVEAIALDPDTPRARVLLDAVRQSHAAPPGSSPEVDAARARLNAWLAAPGEAVPGETVPLPLGETAWRRLAAEAGAPATEPARFVLSDRRAALVYTGAMALDDVTVGWLRDQPKLLRRLFSDYAGPFAAFGRSVRVVSGAAVLPGSPEVQRLLEELVGEPRRDPAAFVARVLGRHDGRLAYFLDTVAHLEPARQRLAFAEEVANRGEREDRVRTLVRTFLEWAPAWRVGERPFTRPLTDPAWVLREVRLTPDGHLAPPVSTAVWDAVFGEGTPWTSEGWLRRAGVAPPADIAWLTWQILQGDVRAARERLGAVLFLQDTLGGQAGTPAAALARIGRGFIAERSLVLTLHRLGVDDAPTYLTALEAAAALPGDGAARVARLALFQAGLAMLDRAHHAGGIDGAEAAARLAELLAFAGAPQRAGDPGRASAWLAALAGGPVEGSVEARLLSRLAGAPAGDVSTTAADGRGAPAYTWEGARYTVSLEGAERARLISVRARQAGNSLDAVLALAHAVEELASTGPGDSLLARCRAVEASAVGLEAIPWPDVGSATLTSPEAVVREACGHAGDLRGARPGTRDVAGVLGPLRALAIVALADAVTAITYALHAGEPQEAIDLAPDLARRHDYDLGAQGRAGQPRGPWSLPEDARTAITGWHVRGSVTLLEHALSSHVLRRLAGAGMPSPPTLSGDEQRTLALSVALMSPRALDDAARDRLVGVTAAGCAGVEAGRGDPAALDALAARLGWSGARRSVLAWAARHEPAAVPGLFSAAECHALGTAGPPAPELDAWGAASLPDDGRLRLVWPGPDWEEVTGRSPGGLLATRFVDLTLRAAAALAEAGLPARLVPGVLAAAVQDLISEARMGHADDFPALLAHVRRVPPERWADYLAALSANGPLVPVEAGSGGAR